MGSKPQNFCTYSCVVLIIVMSQMQADTVFPGYKERDEDKRGEKNNKKQSISGHLTSKLNCFQNQLWSLGRTSSSNNSWPVLNMLISMSSSNVSSAAKPGPFTVVVFYFFYACGYQRIPASYARASSACQQQPTCLWVIQGPDMMICPEDMAALIVSLCSESQKSCVLGSLTIFIHCLKRKRQKLPLFQSLVKY